MELSSSRTWYLRGARLGRHRAHDARPPLAVSSAVLVGKASVLGGGSGSSTISSVLSTNTVLANQQERRAAGDRQQGMVDRKGHPFPHSLGGFSVNGAQPFNNAPGGFDSFAGINAFHAEDTQCVPDAAMGKDGDAAAFCRRSSNYNSPNLNRNNSGKFTQQPQRGGLAGDRAHTTSPRSWTKWVQFDVSWTWGRRDSEKARKVLEGTALKRVVDSEPVPAAVSAVVDVKASAAKLTVIPDAKPVSRANPTPLGARSYSGGAVVGVRWYSVFAADRNDILASSSALCPRHHRGSTHTIAYTCLAFVTPCQTTVPDKERHVVDANPVAPVYITLNPMVPT
ncbi:hypothetical protein BV22DRAFT_1052294 [Leucogyrophana mollusca]|uniref:Uncharacterized protein n=1 Tax=Leucogyrophana mollusca TaxID=85980 RepID=A0ACB8AXE6_9AGAM|nr:hypothetical protein BV22DRAFT_1052294 [Leucogyrophana mollusca]